MAALGATAVPMTLSLFENASLIFSPIMVRLLPASVALSRVTNQNVFFAPQLVYNQFVTESLFINDNRFSSELFFTRDVAPYTYPIGRYPDSDYGIRSSVTYYKRRLIIGRH